MDAALLIRELPKAELHVHLEGTLDVAEVVRLARRTGQRVPEPYARLLHLAPGTDGSSAVVGQVATFLEFLDWECGLLETADDLADVAYRAAGRETSSGARYADVIVNPTHFGAWRHDVYGLLRSLSEGFDAAEQDGLCAVGICPSLRRDQSASEANELVALLLEKPLPRVVALSIDGDETAAGRTGPRFAEAFAAARAGGLATTAHAGESSGPDGVWDALDVLQVERIDHGVRAIEDPRLVAELALRRITLNICPRSNLVLGLYVSRAHHPIEALRQAGVAMTVNTDDPAIIGARLEDEWLINGQTFGWDTDVYTQLARASLEAAFCDQDRRRSLLRELDAALTPRDGWSADPGLQS
ncbi:MAG TPA: adenosine deaminase [Acidimicrobiales bacterium]|nr:adenosine deaminase [Acidimicrobiales bacterium]